MKDSGEYCFVTPIHAEFVELKKVLADVNSELSCFLNEGKPPTSAFSLFIKREVYDPSHTLAVFIPNSMKDKIADSATLTCLLNKNTAYKDEFVACSIFFSKDKDRTGVAAVSFKSAQLVDYIVDRGTIFVQLDDQSQYCLRVRRFNAQRSQRPAQAKGLAPVWPISNVVKKRTPQILIQPVVFAADDSLSFMKECIDLQSAALEKLKADFAIREKQERMKDLLLNNPNIISDISKVWEENNRLRALCEKGKISVPARADCSEATQKFLAASKSNTGAIPALPESRQLVPPPTLSLVQLPSSSSVSSAILPAVQASPPALPTLLDNPSLSSESTDVTIVSTSPLAVSGLVPSLLNQHVFLADNDLDEKQAVLAVERAEKAKKAEHEKKDKPKTAQCTTQARNAAEEQEKKKKEKKNNRRSR
jgi:hypothetical protein